MFPDELLAEIGYSIEYSDQLKRVLDSVLKGGRAATATGRLLSSSERTAPLPALCGRRTSRLQGKPGEQVFFQDSTDLEKAVRVLRGYREMLRQGMQLVQMELNAQCNPKQNDLRSPCSTTVSPAEYRPGERQPRRRHDLLVNGATGCGHDVHRQMQRWLLQPARSLPGEQVKVTWRLARENVDECYAFSARQ